MSYCRSVCDVLTGGNGSLAYRRLLKDDFRSIKERVLSDHGTAMVGIAKQYLLAPAVIVQQRFLAQLCGFSSRKVVNAYIEAAYEIVKAAGGVESIKPKLVLCGAKRFRNHVKLYNDGSKRRFRQSETCTIGPHMRMVYDTAEAWSKETSDAAKKVGLTILHTPEHASVAEMDFDAYGWLWKHSLPSVVFPSTMKRLLIKFFNEIPHVSPEGAILRLKALPQYRLDVFVEFLLTPMRVMRYFTTLNKYRKDHKIASNMPVPEHIADIEGDNSQYQGIGNKPKLAALICRRKISFLKPSQLCKPSFDRRVLVQMLLDDDAKLEDNHGSKFEEEAFEEDFGAYYNSRGALENEGDADSDGSSDNDDDDRGEDHFDLGIELDGL